MFSSIVIWWCLPSQGVWVCLFICIFVDHSHPDPVCWSKLVTCLCQGPKGLRWAPPIPAAKKATIDRPGATCHYIDLQTVRRSAQIQLHKYKYTNKYTQIQIQKQIYTNTNTKANTQIQKRYKYITHKSENTHTNTQIRIQKYKRTNTQTGIQIQNYKYTIEWPSATYDIIWICTQWSIMQS